ncbi:hypothetical protein P8452_69023 [Trifolium repens]|nr:hypothetical protein P8452_69023 [Trifolium repens]
MDMDANVVDLERRKRHSHILKQLPGHFIAKVSTLKRKRYPASSKDGTSVLLTDPWKTVQTTVSSKSSKDGASIEEVKETISLLLQLPSSLSNLNSTGCDDLLSDVKFLLWLMPRAFLLSSLKRSKLKEQMHFTVLLLAVESAGLQTPIAFLEHNKENFSKKYAGGKYLN